MTKESLSPRDLDSNGPTTGLDGLPEPYGGTLVDLLSEPDMAAELRRASQSWPSWTLTPRQTCDLEMLLDGSFSPLRGFMRRAEVDHVAQHMRLPDGTLWPLPVLLGVTREIAVKLESAPLLALRDEEGVPLAALHVEDVWELDRTALAEAIFGTLDTTHPGVADLFWRTPPYAVGGRIEGITRPTHHDFPDLRHTPASLRRRFAELGWQKVVAFQTRNPIHRAHFEITRRASAEVGGGLLLHPVVGVTKPGDVDHYTRVRCYRAVLPHYPPGTVELSLLPLAMRMGGPREALFHAIIRRNYGCTHLIVGRDHAGPGASSTGHPFYPPLAAQELAQRHQAELGIRVVPFDNMVYLENEDRYVPQGEVPPGAATGQVSGTELRRRLDEGTPLPSWYTFPEVDAALHAGTSPKRRRGFTVFFTGLSGAGKSTLAQLLRVRLLERGGRQVSLLDGDMVRGLLSSELGFSKRDRDLNIRRIGFVAAEVTRCGGIAVCAPIAPYDNVRQEVRSMVESGGGFVLVHVSTPLEVCEQRDRKGLYAKARAGLIAEFTGISDPYEAPSDADLELDTSRMTADEAVDRVLLLLERQGYF